MTTTTRIGAASALLFSLILGVAHADTAAPDLEARRATLNQLIKEQWDYTMRNSPEWASLLGDKRFNDKWSDFSQAGIDADLKASADFLKRFEAVDTTGFPLQEQLNRELMMRQLRQNVDGARFKDWEMPLAQNSGVHLDIPQIVPLLPFETVKDYEDYIKRLHTLPKLFEQTRVQMENGVKDKLMPPQFLIPQIVKQCEDVAAMKPADSPYAEPLKRMPKTFSAADKARLTKAILAAVKSDVAPAYKKLAVYTKTKYLPHGRKDVGMWSLPDGDARYTFKARNSTTTDMTPEQIHQLGLSEVARIEGQMLETAKKLGYSDLKSFNKAVAENPALHPKSRQEIVDLYQKYTDQMYPQLPTSSACCRRTRWRSSRWSNSPRRRRWRLLHARFAGRQTSGPRAGQYRRLRTPLHHRHRNHRAARRRAGSPHAADHRAGDPGPAGLPPARRLHGLRGRLGAVLGASGRRAGLLQGPLQLLRPFAG
jgi:uncharacterized protein (DUF885 family)